MITRREDRGKKIEREREREREREKIYVHKRGWKIEIVKCNNIP